MLDGRKSIAHDASRTFYDYSAHQLGTLHVSCINAETNTYFCHNKHNLRIVLETACRVSYFASVYCKYRVDWDVLSVGIGCPVR